MKLMLGLITTVLVVLVHIVPNTHISPTHLGIAVTLLGVIGFFGTTRLRWVSSAIALVGAAFAIHPFLLNLQAGLWLFSFGIICIIFQYIREYVENDHNWHKIKSEPEGRMIRKHYECAFCLQDHSELVRWGRKPKNLPKGNCSENYVSVSKALDNHRVRVFCQFLLALILLASTYFLQPLFFTVALMLSGITNLYSPVLKIIGAVVASTGLILFTLLFLLKDPYWIFAALIFLIPIFIQLVKEKKSIKLRRKKQ